MQKNSVSRRICMPVCFRPQKECRNLTADVLQLHLPVLLATPDAVKQVRQPRLHVQLLIPWGLAGKNKPPCAPF